MMVNGDLVKAILSYPNTTAFAKVRILFDVVNGHPLDRVTYKWLGEIEDAHKAPPAPPVLAPAPKLVQ